MSEKMREALEHVKQVVDNSDQWWIDDPRFGGIDMELVNAALAAPEQPDTRDAGPTAWGGRNAGVRREG